MDWEFPSLYQNPKTKLHHQEQGLVQDLRLPDLDQDQNQDKEVGLEAETQVLDLSSQEVLDHFLVCFLNKQDQESNRCDTISLWINDHSLKSSLTLTMDPETGCGHR